MKRYIINSVDDFGKCFLELFVDNTRYIHCKTYTGGTCGDGSITFDLDKDKFIDTIKCLLNDINANI